MRTRKTNGRLKQNVFIFFIILVFGLINLRAKCAPQNHDFIWHGVTDSDWHRPDNWLPYGIPASHHDVLISATATHAPEIRKNASCRNLTIEKDATLIISESSRLAIEGNVKNSGAFLTGESTVVFAGNMPQILSSTSPIEIYNLEINNTSNLGVSADCKIKVVDELILRSGIFSISDTICLLNIASNAIYSFSEKSYVNGKLQRSIAPDENKIYLFPVGNINEYYPAHIEIHSLSQVKTLTVSFSNFKDKYPTQITASDKETRYSSIISDGIWTVTPEIEPTGGWYDIKLGITSMKGLADNHFTILKRITGGGGDSWSAEFGSKNPFGGEGRLVADGYALSKYCTSFSEYTIGRSESTPPPELLFFEASLENGSVNLSWATGSESNIDYFIIEKSNGVDVREVATIKACGTNSVQNNYSYTDNKPFRNISHYRLKQVGKDSVAQFSKMATVTNKGQSNAMALFQNTAERKIRMQFSDPVEQADVVIFNQIGAICINKSFSLKEENPSIELSLKNELAPGVYYLQVSAGYDDIAIQQFQIR